MGARVTRGSVDRGGAAAVLVAEGCSDPRPWSNGPGDAYGRHVHGYHKVLFCIEGSIVFHLEDRDEELTAGDRLDLAPGTPHAATVGPQGCACMEATKP
jgi:mannose-6-phosphate isomerase-like protein (cupin superfamily)